MDMYQKALHKIAQDQLCQPISLIGPTGPQGPTGATGPAASNHYALILNQNPTILQNQVIPLQLAFSRGNSPITVSGTIISLPSPATYYISYSLTGTIGTGQTSSIIPIFNSVPQNRYYSINNTNTTNDEITIKDGLLLSITEETQVQFWYRGSADEIRSNLFISIFQISVP